MSWNISTRLNNLQQQVNNIANSGLTNPLEQILDANNYSLTNLNILNSGSNLLQLQSSNDGGITTNCDFTADGNITCQTLNYTELNPPINPNGITFDLLGSNVSEITAGNFDLTNYNPYNGIITHQQILNPTVQLDFSFSSPSSIDEGSNSFSFGFSTSNTLYPTGGFSSIQYGIFYYPTAELIYQIQNGQVTSATYSYNNKTDISVLLKIVNGNLKIFINNVEVPELEQPLSGAFYFVATGYIATGFTGQIRNLFINQTNSETLSQVLSNGNDAGNQNITGINSLTCSTLNYTTLNPPPSLQNQNLNAVLLVGNDANNQNIQNINTLSGQNINMTGNIYCDGYLEVGDKISNTAQIHLFYGNGSSNGNNYQIVCSSGDDNFQIQQYKNNNLYNQPLTINDTNNIKFKTNNLIYTQDGNTGYYIIDTFYNPPMYKQILNSISGSQGGFILSPKIFFSNPVYTKNNPNNNYYGVNYGEILFSSLNLIFGINSQISPPPTFSSSCNATIFLSSTGGTESYNPALANSIVIPMIAGATSSTFNSSVPILLYCNSSTQFNKLYLMIYFNVIPPIGSSGYSCTISNSNMVISGYITNNQNGTITFGS